MEAHQAGVRCRLSAPDLATLDPFLATLRRMKRRPRIALLGALACLAALVAVWAVAYLAPFGRWLDDVP